MDVTRTVYSVILALLVALTIVHGIQAAYPGPEEPAVADVLEDPGRLGEIEDFKEDDAVYERNVFLIGTTLAIIISAAALLVLPPAQPIPIGVLLGGLLSLIWAAEPDVSQSLFLTGQDATAQFFPGAGLDTAGRLLQFLTALAALAIMLLVGYLRFRKPVAVTAGPPPQEDGHGESQVEVEREELHERR